MQQVMCRCLEREDVSVLTVLFSLLCLSAERVREHQQDHVSREPAPGIRPLRLPADPADLRPAGAGVESLCGGAGRAQHLVGDVCQLPPEGRPGTDGQMISKYKLTV